jgi:hypothetical protein
MTRLGAEQSGFILGREQYVEWLFCPPSPSPVGTVVKWQGHYAFLPNVSSSEVKNHVVIHPFSHMSSLQGA